MYITTFLVGGLRRFKQRITSFCLLLIALGLLLCGGLCGLSGLALALANGS